MTYLVLGIGPLEVSLFAAVALSLILTVAMRARGVISTPGLILALLISIVLPPINVLLLASFWFYRTRSARPTH